MRDSAVRTTFGISLDRAAALIGVSRPTLTRYELRADAVGEPRRSTIAVFYAGLRDTLERVKRAREQASKG